MLAAQPAPFQSASLYVGDLHADITEGFLFEMFNRVGPVASIRVCRDTVTRRSLGYAYVNFHNVQDAERALDTMNFTEIKEKPCRIMWSQRDPSLRKSGVGNIFVKNLAPTVDNKGLFDVFSVFGNILSCKVANDENGASKGYGYVHYETAEAAQEAIQKVNGIMIEEQEVVVGPFLRRQDRATENEWTNLYCKQFPRSWSEEKVKALFAAYGTISSIKVAVDESGKSKGFGFIDYAEHESAAKAVAELNGKSLEGAEGEEGPFELYVGRAQKKAERVRELKFRIDAAKAEQINKFQGMNLYVKNIDDALNDEAFRELFSPFGTITSSRIMRDEGGATGRGFAFVCYSSPEEATRAVSEMNGKMVHGKPLFVTLHQRKDIRRAHLAATHNPAGRGMGGPMGGRFPMGQAPMPYMGMYPGQGMPPRPFPMMPGNMMPRGPAGRGGPGPNFPQGGRGYPMPQYNGMGMPGQMQGPGFNRGGPAQVPAGANQGLRRMVPQPSGRGIAGGRAMPPQGFGPRGPPVKFNGQMRNHPGQMQMGGQMAGPPPMQMGGLEPLDSNALAQAEPAMQKNMIGERLYPLIMQHQPELAGKITGMLLEMDNAELLHLIESPEALMSKMQEALSVLQAHSQN
jgi:polyadenylate-binding protein